MKKPYNIILVVILLMNFVFVILLFQQNALLTEYSHRISSLEVKMKDLDEAMEEQVIPDLRGIYNKTNWEVRHSFRKNGKEILRILPEAGLSSGKHFGYIFNFSEPFESFKGKEIAVYAYHRETDERITAVPPGIVTESTTGFPSMERFTASFVFPKSGLWRVEIELDGEYYADVVLSVK
ncbi:hypothetical protein [Bacillus sp. AK031]